MGPFYDKAQEIFQWSKGKGWWLDENVPTKLALIHSEVSEALEEYRDFHEDFYYSTDKRGNPKPEGMGVELIDTMIRILDLLGYMGVDVDELLKIKMEYNESREYQHGGKRV